MEHMEREDTMIEFKRGVLHCGVGHDADDCGTVATEETWDAFGAVDGVHGVDN